MKEETELKTVLEKKLHSSVKPEESMWSLLKGECVQVGAYVVCSVPGTVPLCGIVPLCGTVPTFCANLQTHVRRQNLLFGFSVRYVSKTSFAVFYTFVRLGFPT